ncbi:MAG: GTP cyclohydrolase FolE2 [Pirellulales bacterium]
MSTEIPSSETGNPKMINAASLPRPLYMDTNTKTLPDVANDTSAQYQSALDRVGMSGIEVAIKLRDSKGELFRTPAKVDAFVNLDDPKVKGIHMSRLYLGLQRALDEEFNRKQIESILVSFLETHEEMSSSSYVSFEFEHMIRQESLLSDHSAWRSYPIKIEAYLRDGQITYRVHVRLTYSSACPCSAALSRQLLQQQFEEQFDGHNWISASSVLDWIGSNQTMMAVPHSQRSHADITIQLAEDRDDLPFEELIERTEGVLNTAVQAAVKRADEQEFARINGENLMFCEDAARRMQVAVELMSQVTDFRIQARHFESLHPHDAVAVVTKGVPGGMVP